MQQRKQIILLFGLAVVASVMTACSPVQPGLVDTASPATTPTGDLVTLTLNKSGDKSTLGIQDDQLLIDIESAGGIGTAAVTWTVTPTTPVLLRLHLAGLEELRLTNGDVETVASVSSSPPHTVSQSTRSGPGVEQQSITGEDPAWLDITWSSGASEEASAATATFPLQDSYFDILLSDPRLTQPGNSLDIQWIDFYR